MKAIVTERTDRCYPTFTIEAENDEEKAILERCYSEYTPIRSLWIGNSSKVDSPGLLSIIFGFHDKVDA